MLFVKMVVVAALVSVVACGGGTSSPTSPSPSVAAPYVPPPTATAPVDPTPEPPTENPTPAPMPTPVPSPPTILPPNTVAIMRTSHDNVDLAYTKDGVEPETSVSFRQGDIHVTTINNGVYAPLLKSAYFTKDGKILRNTRSSRTVLCNRVPEGCIDPAGNDRLNPGVQEWVGRQDEITEVDGVVVIYSPWFTGGSDPKYVTDEDLKQIGVIARTDAPMRIKYHSR